jgi:hypothetical protein
MTLMALQFQETGKNRTVLPYDSRPSKMRDRLDVAWEVYAGPEGEWWMDTPGLVSGSRCEETDLPIWIMTRDGRRVIRTLRSRWARGKKGRVEDIQVLCRGCSTPVEVRDLGHRLAGMFSCHLACPSCARGTLVCGSRRTLLMTIRIKIAEMYPSPVG